MTALWLAGVALCGVSVITRTARRSLILALVGVLALTAAWWLP